MIPRNGGLAPVCCAQTPPRFKTPRVIVFSCVIGFVFVVSLHTLAFVWFYISLHAVKPPTLIGVPCSVVPWSRESHVDGGRWCGP